MRSGNRLEITGVSQCASVLVFAPPERPRVTEPFGSVEPQVIPVVQGWIQNGRARLGSAQWQAGASVLQQTSGSPQQHDTQQTRATVALPE